MSLRKIFSLLFMLASLWPVAGMAQGPEPVVHAILFYSPTCPHCHEVITNHLIPLQNRYGSELVIVGMDTSQSWANELFWAALRHFGVPEEKWAVPFMIVGDEILVGGDEIPDRFPAILEEGLATGGIDLPNLPELLTFMSEEGLLDERYPDRRIALQTPREPSPQESATAQEREGAGAPGEEGSAPDSVSQASPDSIPVAEKEPARGEEATRDTAPGPAEVEPDIPAPPDTAAEALQEPAAGSWGDSERGAATQENREDSALTGAPGTGGSTPPPETGNRSPAAGASGGGLGLGEAATRLESMSMWDRFAQDPTGNSLSALVLFGMLASLFLTGFPGRVRRDPWPAWTVPVLVVLGAGVASYLSFVEVTQVEAACGPVGDCNTVNQSEHAVLFGVLPVGVLGLMGYGLILLLWGLGLRGPEAWRSNARLGLWGAALFGVAFSAYLTFLEPFVIGATCAWCLSSAVIMTLLLWAVAPLAARVWPGVREGRRERQVRLES